MNGQKQPPEVIYIKKLIKLLKISECSIKSLVLLISVITLSVITQFQVLPYRYDCLLSYVRGHPKSTFAQDSRVLNK